MRKNLESAPLAISTETSTECAREALSTSSVRGILTAITGFIETLSVDESLPKKMERPVSKMRNALEAMAASGNASSTSLLTLMNRSYQSLTGRSSLS